MRVVTGPWGKLVFALALLASPLVVAATGAGAAGDRAPDSYESVVGDEACPPDDPVEPVVVCGPVPDGYDVPEPGVPANQLDGFYVAFPAIVPDKGDLCPLPQDLGPDVLATVCGPSPFKQFPPPPFFDDSICAEAEKELATLKAAYSEHAPPEEVEEAFPPYDPSSCRVILNEPADTDAIVTFQPLDPEDDVPPVHVRVA